MLVRSATYAAEVSFPFRALIAAALGCVLAASAPAAFGASSRSDRDHGQPNGYSRSEARQVLHQAKDLMQNGPESTGRPATSDLTMALRDLHLARPALTGADRRAADRLLSRSTPAAKAQAAAPALQVICRDHFCVHYAAPTTTKWAETTWTTLEHVWATEVPLMGRAPISDNGSANPTADNPDDRLDVYLEDLGSEGYYGYCTSDDTSGAHQVAAYCALDDDFAKSQFGAAPLNSLRVTAAHEFFHAI